MAGREPIGYARINAHAEALGWTVGEKDGKAAYSFAGRCLTVWPEEDSENAELHAADGRRLCLRAWRGEPGVLEKWVLTQLQIWPCEFLSVSNKAVTDL